MHIIFVCTGNTCRSPMAEALLKKKTDAHTVESAGLSVSHPAPAHENAVRTMAEYGMDITNHVAKPLTPELVEKADLLLTMTRGHRALLCALFPAADEKTFTLAEYAGCAEDVEDPFGGDMETYRAAAAQIAAYIEEAPL